MRLLNRRPEKAAAYWTWWCRFDAKATPRLMRLMRMELRLSWASGRRGVILRVRRWEGCWNLWFLGWLRGHDCSISWNADARSTCHATAKENPPSGLCPCETQLRCINGEVSSREVKPDDDQDVYHDTWPMPGKCQHRDLRRESEVKLRWRVIVVMILLL
jgi:hypothetical protein